MKYTGYKAEEAGIPLIKVDPAYTSQMCSECGTIIPKTLDDRMHTCSVCGLSIPRDRNAAINILKRARGADLHCASNENHSPNGGSDLRHTSESCKTGVTTHWFNIAKE